MTVFAIKKWISACVFLLFGCGVFAQIDSATRLLLPGIYKDGQKIRIGQKVPDLTWKMFGKPGSTKKLSDFKGKLVMLDFWSFGCSSCIDFMPRFEALEKQFTGSLALMPITFQSSALTRQLYDQQKKLGKPLKEFSAIEDTASFAWFSSYMNPMIVWIGKDRTLLAVTSPEYVTPENIAAAIAGKPIHFADYSRRSLSPSPDTVNQPLVISGSLLTERRFGNRAMMDILQPAPGSRSFTEESVPLLMYVDALEKTDSAVIAEMKTHVFLNQAAYKYMITNFYIPRQLWGDSLYLPGSYNPSRQHYVPKDLFAVYYYDQVGAESKADSSRYRQMMNDLNHYFGLSVKIEKRKVAVLSLQASDDFHPGRASDTTESRLVPSIQYGGLFYTNYNHLSDYVQQLNSRENDWPIIFDDTHYNKRLDLPAGILAASSLLELQQQLDTIHLRLVPQQKEMDMIVMEKLSEIL